MTNIVTIGTVANTTTFNGSKSTQAPMRSTTAYLKVRKEMNKSNLFCLPARKTSI